MLQNLFEKFSVYFHDKPYNFYTVDNWLNNSSIQTVFENNYTLYEMYTQQYLNYDTWWHNKIGIRNLYYNIINEY